MTVLPTLFTTAARHQPEFETLSGKCWLKRSESWQLPDFGNSGDSGDHLFLSQRHHRIHAHGPPRWYERSQQRYYN
jgi:hypothetical protein